MLTKKELMALPLKVRDIERAKLRIEKMRTKLYSPKGFDSRERVQTSGSQRDAMADMVIDLEMKVQAEQEDVEKLTDAAGKMFTELDPEAKQLMTMRYIGALSWPDIAEVMHYSPPSLFRKHRAVLCELYPEECREE